MDFSKLQLLEDNVMEITDRLDTLKDSLLVDKSIDDYYEYASYVESLSQILWDMEYYLNEIETEQDHADNLEYISVRWNVSSDAKANALIEVKFHDNKREISHYRWMIKRLRARYWWSTHVISALHDRFYFSSRINA